MAYKQQYIIIQISNVETNSLASKTTLIRLFIDVIKRSK